MGIKTAIEYCDSTVNPIMGCTGCELYHPDPSRNHCYAATLVNRYAGRKGWPKQFNQPEHFPERLEKAIKWSDLTGKERPNKPWLNGSPRVIFVNDLSDGFCPDVSPEEWLLPHLKAMSKSPHIWLLLTKWPKKMRLFCELYSLPSNVWPGVTVMRQKDEWRIEELLQIEAARYWMSGEPLLEEIDISPYMPHPSRKSLDWDRIPERGEGFAYPFIGISWVVAGFESGPNARPGHPDWARRLRDNCQEAEVPFLWKQWGAFQYWEWDEKWQAYRAASGESPVRYARPTVGSDLVLMHNGSVLGRYDVWADCAVEKHYDIAKRVGKKRAGHLLDGQIWREFPAGRNPSHEKSEEWRQWPIVEGET